MVADPLRLYSPKSSPGSFYTTSSRLLVASSKAVFPQEQPWTFLGNFKQAARCRFSEAVFPQEQLWIFLGNFKPAAGCGPSEAVFQKNSSGSFKAISSRLLVADPRRLFTPRTALDFLGIFKQAAGCRSSEAVFPKNSSGSF